MVFLRGNFYFVVLDIQIAVAGQSTAVHIVIEDESVEDDRIEFEE